MNQPITANFAFHQCPFQIVAGTLDRQSTNVQPNIQRATTDES
jgi:hypothetical protein